jgi:hypothetical protein
MKKRPGVIQAGLFAAVLLIQLLISIQPAVSETDAPAQFGIEGGHFTCALPDDWQYEIDGPQEDAEYLEEGEEADNTYQLLLLGPSAEGVPVMIFVSYFGPDNYDFNGYQDFIGRNTTNVLGERIAGEVKSTAVNGRDAFWFEREKKTFLYPESKSEAAVMIKDSVYVLQGNNRPGFFVLEYTAPSSVFGQYADVFEGVVNSFQLL